MKKKLISLILLTGKLRRFYLSTFRPKYTQKQLEKRKGDCARCGVCCKLAYKCWHLKKIHEATKCTAYKFRPMNCRIFPLSNKDLHERNLVSPNTKCGYFF